MEAGEILRRRGLLDDRQLDVIRANMNGGKLLDTAVSLGLVKEEAALRALGEEVGIDYVDLAEADVDLTLLKNFPQRVIYRQTLFPLRRENGALVVATS